MPCAKSAEGGNTITKQTTGIMMPLKETELQIIKARERGCSWNTIANLIQVHASKAKKIVGEHRPELLKSVKRKYGTY